MFFFMADTHFGHGAIIDLCHRPFQCVEEMDGYMIERWNKKVSPNDIVYIVGDLFYKHKEPEKVLKQLKGRKRLIIGNHDGGWLKKLDASRYFFNRPSRRGFGWQAQARALSLSVVVLEA